MALIVVFLCLHIIIVLECGDWCAVTEQTDMSFSALSLVSAYWVVAADTFCKLLINKPVRSGQFGAAVAVSITKQTTYFHVFQNKLFDDRNMSVAVIRSPAHSNS